MLDCPGSFLGQDNIVLESGEMAEPADKIARSDFEQWSKATLARRV